MGFFWYRWKSAHQTETYLRLADWGGGVGVPVKRFYMVAIEGVKCGGGSCAIPSPYQGGLSQGIVNAPTRISVPISRWSNMGIAGPSLVSRLNRTMIQKKRPIYISSMGFSNKKKTHSKDSKSRPQY